jgi:hypothetical protein
MNPEVPDHENNELQESIKKKEEYWNAVDQGMDDVGDALGKKIDPGIRKTVVALNVIGLPPQMSCEGHLDRGCPHPWIDIGEPDEPERYKSGTKQETDEYKKWRATNKELRGMAEKLLEEFYSGRKVAEEKKIDIEDAAGGRFRLQNGANLFLGEKEYGIKKKKISKLAKDLTDAERERLKTEYLPALQTEMDAFAEFMKNKFLEDENI